MYQNGVADFCFWLDDDLYFLVKIFFGDLVSNMDIKRPFSRIIRLSDFEVFLFVNMHLHIVKIV